MARKKGKPEEDPEVTQAKTNLGVMDPPEAERQPLEELNGVAPEPAAPNVRRKQYDRQIETKLEGEEYEDTTRSLLAAMDEHDQLENSKKAVVAEWKEIIGQATEKIETLRNKLTHGKKETVRVEEYRDLDAGTVKIFRLDTQEVLEERPLTQDEQQLDLTELDGENVINASARLGMESPSELDALPLPDFVPEPEHNADPRPLPPESLPTED